MDGRHLGFVIHSLQCYQVTHEDARKISCQSDKQFSRYVHLLPCKVS